MTDAEMQEWLFERYTNLPEYYREEIADGSFNVRDCCFRLMLMAEEQRDALEKERDDLKEALEAVVKGSFYGDSTGYFHCNVKAMKAAKDSLTN